MTRLLFLLITLLLPLATWAEPIDEAEARMVALRWWQQRGVRTQRAAVKCTTTRTGYVFTRAEDFVIVASDDRLPEILGYGSWAGRTKRTKDDALPAALRALLSAPQQADSLPRQLFTAPQQIASRHSFAPQPTPTARTAQYPLEGTKWQAVAPLLKSTRHQYAPYNAACPYWTDKDGKQSEERCIVGCVATAMEQILTYYRRTYTLRDTLHGWQTEHYTIEDVLPGATVDSRLIRNHYEMTEAGTPEVDAVARLSYYLGMAVRMNWGLHESGAHTSRFAEPLRRVFGMKYVHYLDSYRYEPTAFWNFLAQEIQSQRPVYYSGSIMRTGGHAFVLDGLDERGFFHVNWGYDGRFDGYFRLDVLAHPVPEANREDFVESGFFCNQEAIVVCPDSVTNVTLPDTLHRTGREVVVESLTPCLAPQTGCYTPLRLILYNASEQTLTTPFALLLNAPTDTALTKQGEWLNYTGRTLRPHERDTAIIHTLFTQGGERLLSVSPDGEELIYTTRLTIGEGGSRNIVTEAPQVSFPDHETAIITQRYHNPRGDQRAGETFIYDLLDDATGLSARLDHFVYLAPQADTTETVRFAALQPAHSYTFRLRKEWGIVQTLQFRTPANSAIELPTLPTNEAAEWLTLDGRRIKHPLPRGLYLRRQGGRVKKVWMP